MIGLITRYASEGVVNTYTSTPRYISYVICMGTLCFLTGALAETTGWPPLITAVFFSAFSLVVGFLIANNLVFKTQET